VHSRSRRSDKIPIISGHVSLDSHEKEAMFVISLSRERHATGYNDVNSRTPSSPFDGHREHVPFFLVRPEWQPLWSQVRDLPAARSRLFSPLGLFRAFPLSQASDAPTHTTCIVEQKECQERGSALGRRVRKKVRLRSSKPRTHRVWEPPWTTRSGGHAAGHFRREAKHARSSKPRRFLKAQKNY
jgi:hypothetical protein